MNTQVKTSPFVVAIDASYFKDKPLWEGPLVLTPTHGFLENIDDALVVRQNKSLKDNRSYHQIRTYVIPRQLGEDGVVRYFPMMLKQGFGNPRLAGKVNIGYTGSISAADVSWTHDSLLFINSAVYGNASRTINDNLGPVNPDQRTDYWALEIQPANMFIFGPGPDAGDNKLGIIMFIDIPAGMEMQSSVAGTFQLPTMTKEELLAPIEGDKELLLDLTNWSRIFLDNELVYQTHVKEETSFSDPVKKEASEPAQVDLLVLQLFFAFKEKRPDNNAQYMEDAAHYLNSTKGTNHFLPVLELLYDGITNPQLGDQFRSTIEAQAQEYVDSRFTPSELADMAAQPDTIGAAVPETTTRDVLVEALREMSALQVELIDKPFTDALVVKLEKLDDQVTKAKAAGSSGWEALDVVVEEMQSCFETHWQQIIAISEDPNQVLPKAQADLVWSEVRAKVDSILTPFGSIMEELKAFTKSPEFQELAMTQHYGEPADLSTTPLHLQAPVLFNPDGNMDQRHALVTNTERLKADSLGVLDDIDTMLDTGKLQYGIEAERLTTPGVDDARGILNFSKITEDFGGTGKACHVYQDDEVLPISTNPPADLVEEPNNLHINYPGM